MFWDPARMCLWTPCNLENHTKTRFEKHLQNWTFDKLALWASHLPQRSRCIYYNTNLTIINFANTQLDSTWHHKGHETLTCLLTSQLVPHLCKLAMCWTLWNLNCFQFHVGLAFIFLWLVDLPLNVMWITRMKTTMQHCFTVSDTIQRWIKQL